MSGSFRSLVSPALWSQDPEKISPDKAGPENKEGPDSMEGPDEEIPDKLSPDMTFEDYKEGPEKFS